MQIWRRIKIPNWIFKAKHIAPIIVMIVIIIVQLGELEREEIMHRHENATTSFPNNSTISQINANDTQI